MNSFPCRRNGFAGFKNDSFGHPIPILPHAVPLEKDRRVPRVFFMLIVIYDKDFKIECYQSVHVAVVFFCADDRFWLFLCPRFATAASRF